jgi:hypothetical protein
MPHRYLSRRLLSNSILRKQSSGHQMVHFTTILGIWFSSRQITNIKPSWEMISWPLDHHFKTSWEIDLVTTKLSSWNNLRKLSSNYQIIISKQFEKMIWRLPDHHLEVVGENHLAAARSSFRNSSRKWLRGC